MSYSQIEQVKRVIENPDFKQNVRGRLRAALSYLTEEQNIRLSFDYVNHILWISDEVIGNDKRYSLALETAKQFREGNVSIQDVLSARSELLGAYYEVTEHKTVVGVIVQAIRGVISISCQRDLDNAKLDILDKSEVSTYDVANSTSYAIALFTAGDDWDAQDNRIKQIARKLGKEASDKETAWQITHLVELIEESEHP